MQDSVSEHTILISSVAEVPVPSQGWKVNGYCRAVYSEDDVEYEGQIMAVGERYGY